MEIVQPKLRFPEFAGTWEFKSLREITSLITKGTTPKAFSENGVNFIKIECLNGHNIDTSKCLFIDEKTHNKELKRSILKEDDLLFAIAGATIGKCTIVTKEALPANTNQALAIIRLKEKENKDYIFQILTSEGMSKYIKDNISVGAQPNLNLEQINSFSFSYPSLEEQTRIANFLSSVDEKLNLLKEKKSLLEEYKKGIMQKIFNQELRFKDDNGKDFEEWEEKSLGSLCKITTGKLDANAMVEDGAYRFYTCAKDYYRIDKYAFDTEALLISGNGANVGYIHHFKGKFNAYQRTYILDGFNENIIYVKYFLQMNLPKRIKGEKNDGNTPYIVLSTLSDMDFLIPCLAEQTKIANFLSAIDEKIELVSNQTQDAQEYKKGLLQQMFV
ncbi:restriction endonuclease subunit S [Flavobacterium turcicum]|uniref:Restriction endonuclease subunit S n=1 Tax=Flavobacterium turcicum TaxID=2764718 RepID=A0ABR7JJK6_9FLAO|nr:restriction endonuclease subunit S [Flavobacterium turcicum]MBC5864354.1 restriction endonuclease subunit S [Flavobacterium turcicum]NHL02872.1 hypothetical protein [Flavobacterium turcicum]